MGSRLRSTDGLIAFSHLPGPAVQTTKPRLAAGLRRLGSVTGLAVVVAHAARAVVAAELVAVVLVAVPLVVELRRVLDLILRAVHEHRLGIEIEVTNDSGWEHHLLAEDPRARIDDDEAAAGLVGRLVDLADAAVECLDLETGQVDGRSRAAERPDLSDRHLPQPLREGPRLRSCEYLLGTPLLARGALSKHEKSLQTEAYRNGFALTQLPGSTHGYEAARLTESRLSFCLLAFAA